MTNKEKQLRKQKIKGYLLKTLHVICYVLSIAFIGLMVFTGVQSCSKRDTAHANNNVVSSLKVKKAISINESSIVLTPLYSAVDNINVNMAQQTEILASFGYNPQEIVSSIPQVIINLDDEGLIYTGSTSYSGLMSIYLGTMKDTTNDNYYWRFEAIGIDRLSSGVWHYGIFKGSYNANVLNDYEANDVTYFKYYVSSDLLTQYSWLSYFFKVSNPTNFVFNKDYNYNAPMGASVSTPYYYTPSDVEGSGVILYVAYDVGYFISNGEVYNQIRWNCSPTLGAIRVKLNGEIVSTPTGSEQCVFTDLVYINTTSGVSKVVNRRDQIAYMPTSSTYGYYYENSSTWVNDDYRYIQFLQEVNDSTMVKVKAFNNNNQNAYQSNDNSFSNVFTLVGSAFTGLLPILNMQILPYVTIGTLLFIPLVAMLVFAIIRIIKK